MKPSFFRASDCLLLILCAFAAGFAFLKAPGLGDDFGYWWIAWSIHENGFNGWNPDSFHNLRWPIWALIYWLQALFGPGLLAYYAVAYSYLALGGIVAYTVGGSLLKSRAAGWACAIAFFFHPLIDSVIFRPMPDMVEGSLIGLAVLCWMALLHTDSRKRRALFAIAGGVITAVAFSNRFTGIFTLFVLGAVVLVALLSSDRLKWKEAILWLGVTSGTALALFCLEGWVYSQLTGEFLQNIHANLGARGRKGTDEVDVFMLPFRFIGSLSGRGFISPFYLSLTALGAAAAIWKGGVRGRIVVAWAVVLYLSYACSLQSFFPPKPLLRNADRFLCSLAIPFSILAVFGANFALSKFPPLYDRIRRYPIPIALLAVLLLGLATRRSYFNPAHITATRDYIMSVPDGTKVFTHHKMRWAAYLYAPQKAAKLEWLTEDDIIHDKPEHELLASQADAFWFCRKLVWLGDRKAIFRQEKTTQENLASYFADPEEIWELDQVINVGGVPEFVFYKRRAEGQQKPEELGLDHYFPGALKLPLHWKGKGKFTLNRTIEIPPSLRGQPVAIQFEGRADEVQAFSLRVVFFDDEAVKIEDISLRPYLHPTLAIDFHYIAFPERATTAKIEIQVSEKASEVEIQRIHLLKER